MRDKAKNVSTFVALYTQTYFLMKNRIVLFIVGCCALFLASCINDEEVEYELSRDCQILSFSLSSDSIEGLSDVVFTIDQLTGRIFNQDSMPYGTVLNEKVICTVNFASTVAGCKVIQEAIGDTIDWSSGDSLDFSKPVKFVNTLWDGITTRTYQAWINIHQVVPDSMVWNVYKEGVFDGTVKEQKVVVMGEDDSEYYYMYTQPAEVSLGYQLYRSSVADGQNWEKLSVSGLPVGEVYVSQITIYEDVLYAFTKSGELYSSVDGQNWAVVELEETYPVKALLGSLNVDKNFTGVGTQVSALAAVIERNGTLQYAAMNKDVKKWEWDDKDYAVADSFPLSGFGSTTYKSMYRARLMAVAGRDKNNNLTSAVWATDNGKTWVKLTSESTSYFDKQEGVAVAEYDDQFFMLSGINEAGKASSEIYTSLDGGVSWTLSDTLVVMPQDYQARGFASIYVDKDDFMYLFGGKTSSSSNVMNQIWRGRINRLGFDD